MAKDKETTEDKYQFLAKPSDEKAGLSVKDIVNSFPGTTTIHGVPHIANAKGVVKKTWWCVLSIVCLGGLSFHLYTISSLYFRYGVNVVISLEHEEELQFPAVTLCNMSPIRRSLWEAANLGTSSIFTPTGVENSSWPMPYSGRKKRSTSCPSGYTVSSKDENVCYKAVDASVTYTTAVTSCAADGAILATIHSAAEQSAIFPIKPVNDNWIGLKKSGSDWLWEDGEVGYDAYSNWVGGAPGGDAYVRMVASGQWIATEGSWLLSYVCQYDICRSGPSCVQPADCISQPDGNYQLCDRCDAFLQCYNSNGDYSILSCSAGTAWHNDLNYCDWSNDGTSPTCTPCASNSQDNDDQLTSTELLRVSPVEETTHSPSNIPSTLTNSAITTLGSNTDDTLTTTHSLLFYADTDSTSFRPDTSQRSASADPTTSTVPSSSTTLSTPRNDTCSCPCCGAAQDLEEIVPIAIDSDPLEEELPVYLSNSAYERPALREDFSEGEDILEQVAGMENDEKKNLGFNLRDMVIDCQYAGSDCAFKSDFVEFNNPIHGNCYTFNSGWSKPVKTSKRTGQRHGLQLVLNIDQEDYIPEMGDTAGMRIVIHPPNRMPFPEDEGITVNPGEATYVGVRQVQLSRLSGNYGTCKDPLERNIESNVYEEYFDVQYNQMACLKTCHQKHVIDRCGCADAYFPPKGAAFARADVPICSVRNITQDDCKYGVRLQFENAELECDCPNPCNDTLYESTLSTGTWPSDVQKVNLLSKYASKLGDLLTDISDPGKYQRNLLKVIIYYEEFNYQQIKEKIAYTGGSFVSDIGGVLGLWFGCSLLTIIEFLELGSDLVVLKCRNREKGQVSDAETGQQQRPTIQNGSPVKLKPIDKPAHPQPRRNSKQMIVKQSKPPSKTILKNSVPPRYSAMTNDPGPLLQIDKNSKKSNGQTFVTPVQEFAE